MKKEHKIRDSIHLLVLIKILKNEKEPQERGSVSYNTQEFANANDCVLDAHQ